MNSTPATVLVTTIKAAKVPPTVYGVGHRRLHALLALGRPKACHYCGVPLVCPCDGHSSPPVGTRMGQTDHVVPRARGGRSVVANLVPSCGPCNVEKGTR